MPRLMPSSTRPSGHNGDLVPPRTGGGGDGPGRDGGDSRDSIPNYGDRLRRARMSLAFAMTPILMLFISFTVVYVIRRAYLAADMGSAGFAQTWISIRLPWSLLLANTAVLILSSITIELARRAITRESALAPLRSMPGISLGDERQLPWLGVTTGLGVAFLAGQIFVWSKLSSAGFHLAGGTSVSFIYMLTAMHALHLTGGIIALLYANVASLLHRPVELRRIVVDVSAWYWHCMTGLWIYIVILLAFAAG
jgi:cytochrome c oxidase subunit III